MSHMKATLNYDHERQAMSASAYDTTFNDEYQEWGVVYRVKHINNDESVFDGFISLNLKGFNVPEKFLSAEFLSVLEDHCMDHFEREQEELNSKENIAANKADMEYGND